MMIKGGQKKLVVNETEELGEQIGGKKDVSNRVMIN
jgi:hypothetical protein